MPRSCSAGWARSRASGPFGAKRERPGPPTQGATLLLVEDDREMREILAAALCAEGYEVVEAGNEHDTLESVRDRRRVIAVTGTGSSWKRDSDGV